MTFTSAAFNLTGTWRDIYFRLDMKGPRIQQVELGIARQDCRALGGQKQSLGLGFLSPTVVQFEPKFPQVKVYDRFLLPQHVGSRANLKAIFFFISFFVLPGTV